MKRALLLLASMAAAGPPQVSIGRTTTNVSGYLATEEPYARARLLCNLGKDGCAASGASEGVLVASPSKSDPDYWYTWTRDSALVFKQVVDMFTAAYNTTLQTDIHHYIIAQAGLQGVSNPSGSLGNGAGLGEPKFDVDMTEFTGPWGRPQRDGPPLRAIALITYANWLLGNGYRSVATDVLWPMIINDLAYVGQYWNNTGFDLWEEQHGSSFFTTAAQHRALVQGAALAGSLGTTCPQCTEVAPQVLCFLQSYWNTEGYVVSNINMVTSRTGKDVNSILTSIHNFDVEAGCDDTTFQPCSPRALANHKTVTDSFRAVYAINSDRPKGTACAVGRYAEDVFYDGNPWYLATLAGAEQLYAALISWKNVGSISVTPVSLAFFTDLVPGIAAGTYASGSTTYNTIISAVQIYADEYVAIVAEYTPADHSLAEQFLKIGGAPTSAKHLTWSYAALLSAADRREGAVPESWGAAGASLPSACSATSIVGSYASATATNLPATLVTGSPAPAPTTTSCGVVLVKFSAKVTTSYGQTLKLVGSTPALGAWDVYAAPALSAAAYTSTDPVWSVTVALKPSTTFEYKYVIVNSDGSVGWESDPNRAYTVPKACGSYSHSDTWR